MDISCRAALASACRRRRVDMMVGALTDPFDTGHMGITAENIAEQWKISREQQDEFSVESHRRAMNAIEKGYFKDQILPIELKTRKGTTLFDRDEHPRADATLEGMAKLRAVFKKEGSVTAGNASGINDGAAAVVLMERGAAEKKGLKPMSGSFSYGTRRAWTEDHGHRAGAGVDRGNGESGLKIEQMDVVESNEAFAVQALAVSCDLKLDPKKTNPNGGGSAGTSHRRDRAVLTVKALYELQRTAAVRAGHDVLGGGKGMRRCSSGCKPAAGLPPLAGTSGPCAR